MSYDSALKGLRGLFGAPLEGSAPLQFIYLDEAGQEATSPVTVVAGVIVDADRHWRLAESALGTLYDAMVPAQYREGFIFHAKEIWGSKKYREGWGADDRLDFMCEVMALPKALKIPICMGNVWRWFDSGIDWKARKFTEAQWHHALAFQHCITSADNHIKTRCGSHEVATLVAEDLPEMRRFLRLAVRHLRANPVTITPASTPSQQAAGIVHPPHVVEVTRIVDTIMFAEKQDSPLLQLADACAYAFRRYLQDQPHGERFVRALGSPIQREEWVHAGSSATVRFE